MGKIRNWVIDKLIAAGVLLIILTVTGLMIVSIAAQLGFRWGI